MMKGKRGGTGVRRRREEKQREVRKGKEGGTERQGGRKEEGQREVRRGEGRRNRERVKMGKGGGTERGKEERPYLYLSSFD